MELNVKVIRDTNEIIVQLVDQADVKIFRDVSQAINYLRELIEKELSKCEEQEAEDVIKVEESDVKWYIRFPLERILGLLKYAYENKINDVRKLVEEYLTTAGLSKSNARVLVPTLSALKLHVNGKLTDSAILIGKFLHENQLDKAADVLFEHAIQNAVLKEIFEELNTTDVNSISDIVKKVLERRGYSRKDEINYTIELIKFLLRNSNKFRCFIVKNSIQKYLASKRKMYISSIPYECIVDIAEIVLRYIMATKPYVVQNILDNVGARIDRIRVARNNTTLYIIDDVANCIIQVIPRAVITREMLYASILRQELDKLRAEIQPKIRQNRLTFLILMLILVNDVYTKLKLYLEHVLKDQSYSTKIIDLP